MNVEALRDRMKEKNITVTYLSEVMGIDRTTFWRKMNKELDFTRREISITVKILELTDGEILQIFFPESCQ